MGAARQALTRQDEALDEPPQINVSLLKERAAVAAGQASTRLLMLTLTSMIIIDMIIIVSLNSTFNQWRGLKGS